MPSQSESSAINEYEQINKTVREPVKTNHWFYGTEELLDALPRVWTRLLLYLLVGFTAIGLPWAMYSQVDETGSARGRIEPKGATRRLDSQAGGRVTAVRVQEGGMVKGGQILLQLESDVLKSELNQVQTKLQGLQSQIGQLEVLKNQMQLSINTQRQQNKSQELEKIAQINQAQQNLESKQNIYNLQKLEKQALVDQAKQNLDSSQTAHKLANSRLSTDLTEVERYNQLVEQGVIPQIKVVELQKEAQETQQLQEKTQADIQQGKLRIKEEESRYQAIMQQALAEIEQAKLRLKEQQTSYQTLVQAGKLAILRNQEQLKSLQTQISGLRSQIAQTHSEITSVKLQLAQRIVRSPINGVIFELPISKPGAVVQPGQIVAKIAPLGSAFILKANIPSQESGFLEKGMPVKIKFDAYPFQEYGIIKGSIISISPDSKIEQTIQGKKETFELEISLEQPYIQTNKKRILLTPGQTATAEIIVRQRRVIDFILDPFKKLQKSGLEL